MVDHLFNNSINAFYEISFLIGHSSNIDYTSSVKTLRVDTAELCLDFNATLKLSTDIAQLLLGEDTMLLSWYDRERDLESPAGVSECHEGCATKGSWDYALNRGARLAVEFDAGRFFFCFL